MRKRIAILGSTGSIGTNTLKVASHLNDRFEVVALSADSNVESLARQARVFKPRIVSIGNPSLEAQTRRSVPPRTRVASGPEGLKEIVARSDVDLVVFAISGSACLEPLIEAIRSRKSVALANKESLVSAGAIVMRAAKRNGVRIIPVDSEHSAIFQCIDGRREALSKIYLTGSGGPLLNIAKDKFDGLRPEFVLNHPKWKMGRKISVDSATMMNKALEVIEAKHLFGIDERSIEVLIHPEAIIHSMVELVDGAIFAQLGVPDMRIPIQYALTYPQRMKGIARRVDFHEVRSLSFLRPDLKKFPCLAIAREAARDGGTAPAVLNAADEEAVKGYLEGRIRFSDIPRVVAKVLGRHKNTVKDPAIGDILEAEEWAKMEARAACCH